MANLSDTVKAMDAMLRGHYGPRDVVKAAEAPGLADHFARLSQASQRAIAARRRPKRGKVPFNVRTTNGSIRLEWFDMPDRPDIPPEVLDGLATAMKAERDAPEWFVLDPVRPRQLRAYVHGVGELALAWFYDTGEMAELGLWDLSMPTVVPGVRALSAEELTHVVPPERASELFASPTVPVLIEERDGSLSWNGVRITEPGPKRDAVDAPLYAYEAMRRRAAEAFEWLGRIGVAAAVYFATRCADQRGQHEDSGSLNTALYIEANRITWKHAPDLIKGGAYRQARAAELRRRINAADRARRYAVTCQGDHPLDLEP